MTAAPAPRPLISARNLGLAIGGHPILFDVSLDVAPGEIVTIVGPNGSGKSTLMKLLVGAERPGTGTVTRAPGLAIGYVPQRLAIDHTLPVTVDRFLALSGADAGARRETLARVGLDGSRGTGGNGGIAGRQMIDLSGGQFQRVLLALALLRKPGLLMLDEAAQGLDQPGIARFYRLISEIRDELGCGVLMVSHDLHVVMSATDRVICLNGHVCCEGSPIVVSGAPEYRALFGLGTEGALALYRHVHDHSHGTGGACGHHHHPADPGA